MLRLLVWERMLSRRPLSATYLSWLPDRALLPSVLLAAATGILGIVAGTWLGQGANATLILVASVVAIGLLLRAPAAFRPSLPVMGLLFGLSGSLVATTLANQRPPLESYWPTFWLWVLSIAVTLLASLRGSWRRKLRVWSGSLITDRWEALTVLALTAVGLFVRVIDLGTLPSPFQGDEAAWVLQTQRIDSGEIRSMFQSGLQGHPTAYFYLLNAAMSVFGESPFGARMFGAIAGTALIPAVYFMLRKLFDKRVALVGALWVIGYHLAFHYSRWDMNNIGDAVMTSLAILLVWRAVTYGRPADFVIAGLVAALASYIYVGGRVVTLLVLGVVILALILQGMRRQHLNGLVLMVGAFLVAAGPLGLFWYEHPDEFMNRTNSVGIIQSGWLDREIAKTGKSAIEILLEQTKLTVGAFGIYSDRTPNYGGPMPLMDGVSLPFFLLGAAIALLRLFEWRYLILASAFGLVLLTGGILTELPPSSQRLLGTIPVSAALIGLGVTRAATAVTSIGKKDREGPVFDDRSEVTRSRLALGISTVVVLVLVAYNLNYYFGTYVRGNYYSDANTRVADAAAKYARNVPPGTPIYWYGAPFIYVGHPTLQYGVQGLPVFDVLDTGRIVPEHRPTSGPVTFLFVAGRSEDRERIISSCPGGRLEEVKAKEGWLLLYAYNSPPSGDCAKYATAAPSS